MASLSPIKISFDFKDFGYKEIMKQFYDLNGSYAAVGLWGSGDDPESNLAYLGAIQEYGTIKGNIPSRPFMRRTWEHNRLQIIDYAEKLVRKLSEKGITGGKLLATLGTYYEGLMKETVLEGGFLANAPSTIRAKGSDTPLIDTGTMRNSITTQVFIKNHEVFKSFMDEMAEKMATEWMGEGYEA